MKKNYFYTFYFLHSQDWYHQLTILTNQIKYIDWMDKIDIHNLRHLKMHHHTKNTKKSDHENYSNLQFNQFSILKNQTTFQPY